MIFNFHEFKTAYPHLVQKALSEGKLLGGNVNIDLPDGFDLGDNTEVIKEIDYTIKTSGKCCGQK